MTANKIIRNLSKAALVNNSIANQSTTLTTMETMKSTTSSRKKTTSTLNDFNGTQKTTASH